MAMRFNLRSTSGLWISIFLVGVMALVANLPTIIPAAANQPYQNRYEPANTAELLSRPNSIPVKVGGYIENYHDLSLQSRRFSAEGYYWMEWPQALQEKIEKEQIKPIDLLEITNQVDEWDSKLRSVTDGPTRLPNGNYYYNVRFSGNFYIPDLNLRRSPFETIKLPIVIEALDDSLALENLNVVLTKYETQGTLIGSYAEIDGYKLTSADLEPMIHSYGTSWGLNKGDLHYSAMEILAVLKSSPVASLIIWVFPVLIVIGIVLFAPSLSGELGDIRLAIPSTGLLTLIFLQQTYRTAVPALDYLTFLDWLYAYGYFASILTFMLFVWGANTYQSMAESDRENALAHINKIDNMFQLSALLGLLLASALAWFA